MQHHNPPHYDFDNPLFSQRRNYLVYAKEHVELWKLQQSSDVIEWEVKSTVSSLNIPTVYHVTYHLRSIVGIDDEAQPIYGDKHLMEITIPARYPLEPAQIYMRTPVWHPNIQSEGRFVGKICGNVKDYGIDYSLRQLVLRVGEILQYKNYLADFVAPFPEDPKVAEWVKAYAEPRGIVDRNKGIFTDDQPLVRPISSGDADKAVQGEAAEETTTSNADSSAPPPVPGSLKTPPPQNNPEGKATATEESATSGNIKIKRRGDVSEAPKRRKIVLGSGKTVKKEQQ